MIGAASVELSVVADESERVFNMAVPPVWGVFKGLTAVEEVPCEDSGDYTGTSATVLATPNEAGEGSDSHRATESFHVG